MNAKELCAVRAAFNARYATKREWPLRIAKPIVALRPPTVVSPPVALVRPLSPFRDAPVFETVVFCLRDTINRGFGFLFDRIGNSMVVLRIDTPNLVLTLGSVLISIDDKVVDIAGTHEIIMDDASYPTDDAKREAMQLQMINLFKAHGVKAKVNTTCVARFVSSPVLLMRVQKRHPRSQLQRWSSVFLKLQCGYLNWYTTEAAATAATVEMLQHSAVAFQAVHCDVASVADSTYFGFTISEHDRAPEMSAEPREEIFEEDNEAKMDALDVALGQRSKYVLAKRVIKKAPRSATFRVPSAEARNEWLRQLRAAQSFRAEDFLTAAAESVLP
ncbi:hypothetical protein ACHHYP_12641 [Achlya hypogyna]|uniref:PH domain-containing protein n=1 Tax=Achlya hypogyna TaxID=1202772 RepID=A0A1V9YGS7_ACHHY|nr:hypothetical protein ACHHYP_12641 [Achlya hypogyna]